MDRVTDRVPVLRSVYQSGRIQLPSGASRLVHEYGLTRQAGEWLYQFVRRERPKRSLEVGMAFGLSTVFICQALADSGDARHIVLDPNQTRDYQGRGLHHLEQAGLRHLVEFHEESSHRVLPRLEAAGERLDFAFIDGCHLFDYTLLEFFYVDRMLLPGAAIVFDDLQMPAVRKVVRYAIRNRGYRDESCIADTGWFRGTGRRVKRLARGLAALSKVLVFVLAGERHELLAHELGWPRQHGLAVLRKTKDDDRHWKHHVEF